MPNVPRHKDYFEAILQIRPKNNEVLNFVKKQIEKREDTWIAKQEEFKYGVDIYLSSHRFATALARKLKKVFKGDLKITKSLFKRDKLTSKNLYRVTVLFRLKTDSQ